ncbi:EAL domain-containing protein [Cupriavidus agavae]|uniref:cyclic-guanylate-specific phosphodiesterase n=1 Tax=Cupriavidus agavae TaxID=1001822 RepID=A0A4Q7RCD3_9BURK|nr:EAL domain-containing protein [Cupriavidus agavae]RZT30806.1 sensor c-di-GMP phosphodiesterase-like protein [Cupriavidus agavae]
MQRSWFLLVTILLAMLATLFPVGIGVFMAQLEANRRESEQLSIFADAAVGRAEAVMTQALNALLDLESLRDEPCSPSQLVEMRRITYTYRHIQDAGIYRGGKRLCSALLGPIQADQLALPPPDWRTRDNLDFWFDQPNPFAAPRRTLLIGRNGNYVAVDPQNFVDVVDRESRRLAVVNTDAGRIFAVSQGASLPRLQRAYADHAYGSGGETLRDDDASIVLRRSRTMPLAVLVLAPRAALLANWKALLAGGLLVGLAAGVPLGILVWRRATRRFSLEGELRGAVRRHEMAVHYQPIVSLADNRCVGVEALVRWRRQGRLVRPNLFIPMAENAGLIQQITDQVLDIVLTELGTLLRRHPSFYVSINVGVEDLKSRRFLGVLASRLRGTGIAPGQIRIEATERGFLEPDVARDTIQAFRDAGHPVYIDDFGTGYSSLSYLQSFKVDALKIDKSFVDTIGQEAASSTVAPHIIAMAQSLGLQIVAEGIEDSTQADFLREQGVDYGQGWLFGRPVPAVELAQLLARATPQAA